MDQVLVNLIVNALDAMPQGGELIISTDFAEIDETESNFICTPQSDSIAGVLQLVRPKLRNLLSF
jgi:signal transduction histidine kinase